MKIALVILAVYAAVPTTKAGEMLSSLIGPVACSDPETLWDLLAAEEHDDFQQMSRLMGSQCRSLRDTRYVLVGQENGISKLRIFARPYDWSSARLVYTLDEMVEPDHELPDEEPAKVPTGSRRDGGTAPMA